MDAGFEKTMKDTIEAITIGALNVLEPLNGLIGEEEADHRALALNLERKPVSRGCFHQACREGGGRNFELVIDLWLALQQLHSGGTGSDG